LRAQKKEDRILKIPELGEICRYCFKRHTYVKEGYGLNAPNKFEEQSQLSNRLAPVMLRSKSLFVFTGLPQILIRELGRPTGMFLVWFKHSKLSGLIF